MNRYLILLLFILFSCTNKKEELTGITWVISEGFFNGKKIEFVDNSSIVISERYNDTYNHNPKLFFRNNGKIMLPGINSKDLYAKWFVKNDTLRFELDTLKYNYIHKLKDTSEISNKDFFGNDLGMTKKEAIEKHIKFSKENPIKTNLFKKQMNIYGNKFYINIDNGVLILKSLETKIIARKDKSAENIVNKIKK